MSATHGIEVGIPDFALVVLIGATGSGKSTFAAAHFAPTEIISSDQCRAFVCDNENDRSITADAFELVQTIADKRLRHRRLTVIDATNVRAPDRKAWIELARRWHALPVAIVLDPGIDVCAERNRGRPGRPSGSGVVRRMTAEIHRGMGGLQREGFRQVWRLGSAESIAAARVSREPLWTDKRSDRSRFDIIGDVHGCADELETLLGRLGYRLEWVETDGGRRVAVVPPAGRKAVFVGDLVDRGPRIGDVIRIAHAMAEAGCAYVVNGNHEHRLARWLAGRKVTISHGLAESIAQLSAEPEAFRRLAKGFLDGLLSHFWLDGGQLAVTHAGLKAEMIGRGSAVIREFALYGETTGETDEYGLPVRADWSASYRGEIAVVYGHTPVVEAEWVNNTICIDTGCVFGGKLTALRWPERELVSVPAARVYAEPMRPLGPAPGRRPAQAEADDIIDLEDVTGRRWIDTALRGRIVVAEEKAAAALEVMGRYAVAPQCLVYLPPTMSPVETSKTEGWLERPEEALAYYRTHGLAEVVCEEKHMGSRAITALCRTPEVARRRFGILGDATGAVWTRTGRSFFDDAAAAEAMLHRLRAASEAAGLWDEYGGDWLLLDAEIMPWSLKAGGLIENQYRPVAVSSKTGIDAALAALTRAAGRGMPTKALCERFADRRQRSEAYARSLERFASPVTGVEDLRIAPFHVLAGEGRIGFERDHLWHMDAAARLARADECVAATGWRLVRLDDKTSCADAVAWWEELTARGAEGMVVKPRDFVARDAKGLLQPALKVRGREYLRIIYGAEYDAPEHLGRLRERALGRKRDLALREFALGHEALRRFAAGEPLRRVHECVFGVLALESEPIDVRL